MCFHTFTYYDTIHKLVYRLFPTKQSANETIRKIIIGNGLCATWKALQ